MNKQELIKRISELPYSEGPNDDKGIYRYSIIKKYSK